MAFSTPFVFLEARVCSKLSSAYLTAYDAEYLLRSNIPRLDFRDQVDCRWRSVWKGWYFCSFEVGGDLRIAVVLA